MTEMAAVAAIPATDGRLPREKLDQWICWWSIPIFYNLFGLIFVYFTRIMPPPSPGLTQDEIVAFIRKNATNLQIGFVLLALTLGLASLSSGITQRRRMGSTVAGTACVSGRLARALPGCLFAGSCSCSPPDPIAIRASWCCSRMAAVLRCLLGFVINIWSGDRVFSTSAIFPEIKLGYAHLG
jgi:hypothetical protein